MSAVSAAGSNSWELLALLAALGQFSGTKTLGRPLVPFRNLGHWIYFDLKGLCLKVREEAVISEAATRAL